jgi:hypothetical protein
MSLTIASPKIGLVKTQTAVPALADQIVVDEATSMKPLANQPSERSAVTLDVSF